MASAAAELFVKVSADVKGLTRGMDDAAAAIDQVAEEAKKAEQPLARFRDIVGGVAAGELLADGLRSAAQAMVSLGTRSLQLAGELEQNKVAFTTMLKSGEAADKMLRDLATFAASTPFELRGLTDSAKKLIAFGFSSQSIIPIMTSLGDAIGGVGGGKEAIGQVTMALGQMAAKGKVSAEEMNQFAEKGINTWKYVAQAIGKSVPEAMKLAEKGAIDAATAIPAILQGMSKEFGGMMQKQSQTWNGALSNFQDATDQALTKIGNAIIKMGLGDLIRTMTVGINNLAAAFDSGAIIPAIQVTEAAVLGLATAFTAYLLPGAKVAGASMVTAFQAGAAAAAPFIALGAAVAFAAYPIIKNWQEIKWGLQDVFNAGMQYMTQFYNWGAGIVRDFANNWQTGMSYIAGIIRSVLGDTIADKLIGGVRSAGAAFTGFAAKAAPAIQWVGDTGRWTAAQFKETWGDAFSSATKLTVGLFKETATVSPEIKKITAELLGLKKAGASADDLKKKADELAKAQAKAAREAAKHRRELDAQYKAAQASYDKFEAMAMAMQRLRTSIAEVYRQSDQLGRGFDFAGGMAEAMKANLSGIEQAFGKFSPQAKQLREDIAGAALASQQGGAAFAAAAKIVDDASAELEKAREEAQVLGKEFNELEAATAIAEAAMKKLIQQGIKPGNRAYDEQLQKLRDLQAQQKAMPQTVSQIASLAGDLATAFRNATTGLFDIASMIGIEIPKSVKAGAVALATGAGAVIAFTLATDALTVAWAKFTVAFASNPVGAALVIAGAAVVGILAAITAARQTEAAAMTQARQNAQETMAVYEEFSQLLSENDRALRDLTESAEKTMSENLSTAIGSALKEGVIAFTQGAEDYAQVLRDKINKAMFDAILDQMRADVIKRVLKPMTDEIVAAYFAGNMEGVKALFNNLKNETVKLADTFGELAVSWRDTLATGSEELNRMANNTIEKANRLREQHASTLNAVYRTIERGGAASERALAMARVLQGRGTAEDIKLAEGRPEAMALGGLVTGPTFARMGEGGRDEAVLPLNDSVYRRIGEGISAAGGGAGMQVVVQYYGNGKWTREDAQGLGRLLVSELRSMGVRA